MKFIDAVFPVFWVLLFFGILGGKSFSRNRALFFALMLIPLALSVRAVAYLGGAPLSKRYFYPLLVFAAVFAAPGVFYLAQLIHRILQPRFRLKISAVNITLMLIVSAICVGKGLKPKWDKEWMSKIPELIRQNSPRGTDTVLVSQMDDQRPAYFAEARYVRLCMAATSACSRTDKGELRQHHKDWVLAVPGRNEDTGRFMALDMEPGIENLVANLEAMDAENIFLLLWMEPGEIEGLFEQNGISSRFSLLKSYRHKDEYISLYRFDRKTN